jgi:hypothetical protein
MAAEEGKKEKACAMTSYIPDGKRRMADDRGSPLAGAAGGDSSRLSGTLAAVRAHFSAGAVVQRVLLASAAGISATSLAALVEATRRRRNSAAAETAAERPAEKTSRPKGREVPAPRGAPLGAGGAAAPKLGAAALPAAGSGGGGGALTGVRAAIAESQSYLRHLDMLPMRRMTPGLRAANMFATCTAFFLVQEIIFAAQTGSRARARTDERAPRGEGSRSNPGDIRLQDSSSGYGRQADSSNGPLERTLPATERAMPSFHTGLVVGWMLGGLSGGIAGALTTAPIWALTAGGFHYAWARVADPNFTFEPYMRKRMLSLVVREIDREEAERRRENAQYFYVGKGGDSEQVIAAKRRLAERHSEEDRRSLERAPLPDGVQGRLEELARSTGTRSSSAGKSTKGEDGRSGTE